MDLLNLLLGHHQMQQPIQANYQANNMFSPTMGFDTQQRMGMGNIPPNNNISDHILLNMLPPQHAPDMDLFWGDKQMGT